MAWILVAQQPLRWASGVNKRWSVGPPVATQPELGETRFPP